MSSRRGRVQFEDGAGDSGDENPLRTGRSGGGGSAKSLRRAQSQMLGGNRKRVARGTPKRRRAREEPSPRTSERRQAGGSGTRGTRTGRTANNNAGSSPSAKSMRHSRSDANLVRRRRARREGEAGNHGADDAATTSTAAAADAGAPGGSGAGSTFHGDDNDPDESDDDDYSRYISNLALTSYKIHVTRGDVTELRTFRAPPRVAVAVVNEVCILLQCTTLSDADKDMWSWDDSASFVQKRGFFRSLVTFDIRTMGPGDARRLEDFLRSPSADQSAVGAASEAVLHLLQWLCMVYMYAEQLQITPPPDFSAGADAGEPQFLEYLTQDERDRALMDAYEKVKRADQARAEAAARDMQKGLRVMIFVDGSTAAARAVREIARFLDYKHGHEIWLLHVDEDGNTPPLDATFRDVAGPLRAKLLTYDTVEVTAGRDGLKGAILEACATHEIELLVLGVHGDFGRESPTLLETAAAARCSVAFIKNIVARESTNALNVAVAVNASDHSNAALQMGLKMAGDDDHVTATYVYGERVNQTEKAGIVRDYNDIMEASGERVASHGASGQRSLKAMSAGADSSADVLCRFVDDDEVDFLFVGSGRIVTHAGQYGSVAMRLMLHANAHVVVCHGFVPLKELHTAATVVRAAAKFKGLLRRQSRA